MYAMIVRIPFRAGISEDQAAQMAQVAEREIVAPVSASPGFRAYYAVRASDTEVAAFHVWDTEDQAKRGSEQLGALTEHLLGTHLAGAPQITSGEVVVSRQP